MKTLHWLMGALLVGALPGCGDNTQTKICGDGTNDDDGDGICTADGGACLPGTVANAEGDCVPDGTVVCADGTVFDVTTATCVPDASVCGDGTVLVDGICRDPATVTPDAVEAAEPNDGTGAGDILVPAIGAPGFVVHGCITPTITGAADSDPWFVDVTGPTVLDISTDGVAGLSAAFLMIDISGNPILSGDANGDGNADWFRFGLNLVSDGARRQVFLPAAGTYALIMGDSRQFLIGAAAGSADACYYTTVTQVALPTPAVLTAPAQTGTDSGDVQAFRYTAAADGSIFDGTLTSPSDALNPGWVAMRGTTLAGLGVDYTGAAPPGAAPTRTIGNVGAAESIDVYLDMEYNWGVLPQPFVFTSYGIAAEALPTDGSTVTATKRIGTTPAAPYADWNYYYFDVTAGEVVHFDLTTSETVSKRIWRQDIFDGGLFVNVGTVVFDDDFVKFNTAGRYYFAFVPTGLAGEMYTVTSTLTAATPAPIALGTPIVGAMFPTTGSAFYTMDYGTADWIEVTGSGTGFTGTLQAWYYDLAGEGWIENGYDAPFSLDQTFAAAGQTRGRIVVGDPLDYLVRVHVPAGTAVGATYDLSYVDPRPHDNLGMVTPAMPQTRTAVPLAAGATERYLVRTSAGDTVTVTVTPTFDAVLRRLGSNENVLLTLDDPETFSIVAPAAGWIAFDVRGFAATGTGTFDVSVTAVPPPYVVTSGTLPLTDICPSTGGAGVALVQTPDATFFGAVGDEALTAAQTLPFAFDLFGIPATSFYVSTNGWLSFAAFVDDAKYSNSAFPNAAHPNGAIAPYWDDLDNIEICRFDGAASVTIQWQGTLYSPSSTLVKFQTVMHADGHVDFIYGAGHQATGSSATIGVEDLAGTTGVVVSHNTAGGAAPSTSRTLTP